MNFDKKNSHKALTKTKNIAENEESCIKVTILLLINAQTLQLLSFSPSHPPHIAQQNSRLEAPKLLLCTIQLQEEETVFFICVRKSQRTNFPEFSWAYVHQKPFLFVPVFHSI